MINDDRTVNFLKKFSTENVYFASSAHDVYFRWDNEEKKYYQKFRGMEEMPVKKGSDLLIEAILDRNEITEEEYESGSNLVSRDRIWH